MISSKDKHIDRDNKVHPVWPTDCHQLVFPPQGVMGPLKYLVPQDEIFMGNTQSH